MVQKLSSGGWRRLFASRITPSTRTVTNVRNLAINGARFVLFSHIAVLNWHTETRLICHESPNHVDMIPGYRVFNTQQRYLCIAFLLQSTVVLSGLTLNSVEKDR